MQINFTTLFPASPVFIKIKRNKKKLKKSWDCKKTLQLSSQLVLHFQGLSCGPNRVNIMREIILWRKGNIKYYEDIMKNERYHIKITIMMEERKIKWGYYKGEKGKRRILWREKEGIMKGEGGISLQMKRE